MFQCSIFQANEEEDKLGHKISAITVNSALHEQDNENENEVSNVMDNLEKPKKRRILKLTPVQRLIKCYLQDCDETFLYKDHLVHMKKKHDVSLTCSTCNKTSPDVYSAISHQSQVHGKKLKCRKCGKEFNNYRRFRSHWHIHEDLAETFRCEICQRTYHDHIQFKRHLQVTHGEKKVKCDQCDYQTTTAHLLKCHKNRIHLGEADKRICDHCGITFKSPFTLDFHVRKVHNIGKPVIKRVRPRDPEKLKKTKCYFPNCDSFNYFEHVKHMREKHCASEICESCDVKFRNIHESLHHQAKVHNNPMVCSECRREFTNYHAFRTHWNEHEGVSKSIVCETCGKTFYKKWELNQHITRMHGEKRFKCDQCDPCIEMFHRNLAGST